MLCSALIAVLVAVGGVLAGFNANSKTNIALYWGQNSAGQTTTQDRLVTYCQNSDVDIVVLAFLTQFNGLGGQPVFNFANQGDPPKCEPYPGTGLLKCPEIEADIQSCQIKYGKTVLLSIGGATYSEGGFPTPQAAIAGAEMIWKLFGPPSGPNFPASEIRPFGYASVDGFDFDLEGTNYNMATFANRLRGLMDQYNNPSQPGRVFYLAAAPQCTFPDLCSKDILDNVPLDLVLVQFYNNACGVDSFKPGSDSQQFYNFDAWDKWAREGSKKKDVRVLMGVPGKQGAGGGYIPPDRLAPVIRYSKKFGSFSGVMIWDASQAFANGNFIGDVKSSLYSAA